MLTECHALPDRPALARDVDDRARGRRHHGLLRNAQDRVAHTHDDGAAGEHAGPEDSLGVGDPDLHAERPAGHVGRRPDLLDAPVEHPSGKTVHGHLRRLPLLQLGPVLRGHDEFDVDVRHLTEHEQRALACAAGRRHDLAGLDVPPGDRSVERGRDGGLAQLLADHRQPGLRLGQLGARLLDVFLPGADGHDVPVLLGGVVGGLRLDDLGLRDAGLGFGGVEILLGDRPLGLQGAHPLHVGLGKVQRRLGGMKRSLRLRDRIRDLLPFLGPLSRQDLVQPRAGARHVGLGLSLLRLKVGGVEPQERRAGRDALPLFHQDRRHPAGEPGPDLRIANARHGPRGQDPGHRVDPARRADHHGRGSLAHHRRRLGGGRRRPPLRPSDERPPRQGQHDHPHNDEPLHLEPPPDCVAPAHRRRRPVRPAVPTKWSGDPQPPGPPAPSLGRASPWESARS